MEEINSSQVTSDFQPDLFRASATQALARLVSAMQTVITGISPNSTSAADLARSLGIPHKAAWQACKVAESTSPLAAANFVPGKKPTQDLIAGAKAKGINQAATLELSQAFEAYEHLVRKTAGDRSRFIAMLGGEAADGEVTADADRYHRTLAFKCFSHFSGMYADLSLDITIIREDQPGYRTEVSMRTVDGMCRLRSDAQYVVERHSWGTEAKPQEGLARRPLDLSAFKTHGVPIIPAFCSRPLPTLIASYTDHSNSLRVEWGDGQVGIKNPVKVTTATISDMQYVPPNDGKEHGCRFMTKVGYPVKLLARCWLLHMPGRKLLDPRFDAYLDPLAAFSDEERASSPRLRLNEKIQVLPAGSWTKLPSGLSTAKEQIAFCCANLNWDPADFSVATFTTEYPLMNSSLIETIPWI